MKEKEEEEEEEDKRECRMFRERTIVFGIDPSNFGGDERQRP